MTRSNHMGKHDEESSQGSGSTSASSPIQAWGNDADKEDEERSGIEKQSNALTLATSNANSMYEELTPLGEFRKAMTEGAGVLPWGILVTLIVVGNMVALGVETDYGCISGPQCATSEKQRPVWLYLDIFFLVVFILEQLFRALVEGPSTYFRGFRLDNNCFEEIEFEPFNTTYTIYVPRINIFNMIDLTLVFLRFLDLLLRLSGQYTMLKIVTAVRVVNVGFVIVSMRHYHFLKELNLILATVGDTAKAVLWVFVIIAIVLYVLAIFFTTVIGHSEEALSIHLELTAWTMQDHWSTVPRSVYTLLQMMTLDDWALAVFYPVLRSYPILIVPLIFFLVVTGICLLNMITGVVVENTLSCARNNQEKETLATQKLNWKILNSMEKLFHEADTDGSGSIDREELQAMLKNPRVRDRLQMLEIPLKDFDLLFSLLDDARSGNVPIDKFFRGAERLRGVASAADLHHMGVDLARHTITARELTDKLDANNESLGWLLDEIDTVDREILRGDTDGSDPVLKARKSRPKTSRAARLRQRRDGEDVYDEAAARLASKKSVAEERRPSLLSSALRAAANESNAAFKRNAGTGELAAAGITSMNAKLAAPPPATANRNHSKGQKRANFHWGVN